MSTSTFSFKKILNDSNDFLLKPRAYFTSLNLKGGFLDPIIKVLVYASIAGIVSFLLGLIFFDNENIEVVKRALGVWSIVASLVGGIVGAFICGLIVLILSSMCGGNTEFEANFRVAASMMIFFPLSALLPIFIDLSPFIRLALNLYSAYLLYLGITIALKGNIKTARIIAFIFAGLAILIFLLGLIF